jgi:hypothetical protein
MKPTYFIPVIIIFFCLLQSCNIYIEKRRYNPGHHVEVIKKHPLNVYGAVKNIQLYNDSSELQKADLTNINSKAINATERKTQIEIKKNLPEHFLKLGGDDCDVAYLKNGKTILCTYIQITDVIFTYKECGGKTTNIQSIDLEKLDFVVLNTQDTVYPKDKIFEWEKEHGKTDAKTRKQLLRRGVSSSKAGSSILYTIFGILGLLAGVPLLIWAITSLGLWIFVGGFFIIFFAAALIIGGVLLIILAIVNAARK